VKRFVLPLTVTALLLLASLLVFALVDLEPAPVRLPLLVGEHLDASGVRHPVTAVLLNFRGYDTFLEVVVLLLALVGMLAAGLPAHRSPLSGNALLPALARHALPLMLLAAVYLLWAGALQPGGAFQAAAVLAAAAVLHQLAGISPGRAPDPRRFRFLIGAGVLLFLFVAAALLANGALLRYPPERAGLLILLIESGLNLSLAANLAAFFLLRATDPEDVQATGRRS
jgi:multisubunit Na+/H+ antiporter MnhB subunit